MSLNFSKSLPSLPDLVATSLKFLPEPLLECSGALERVLCSEWTRIERERSDASVIEELLSDE
jgi:hypothetical protein